LPPLDPPSRMVCFRKMKVAPVCDAIIPAREDTRSTKRKKSWTKNESLLIVRPVPCTRLLTGHMVLNFSIGEWAVRKVWPLIFCFTTAALMRILPIVFADIDEPVYAVRGRLGDLVEVQTVSAVGLVVRVSNLVWVCASLFIVLHRVHKQLLLMSLSYFDPWVLTLCGLRVGSSYLFSRFTLTEDILSLVADSVDLAIVVLSLWMVICAESADLKRRIRIAVLIIECLLACCLYVHFQIVSVNFDAGADVDILWLAPMQPISQSRNASGTILVLLGKAAYNLVVKGRDFMLLNTHLQRDRASIDALFSELDADGDGVISHLEWDNVLCSLHVPRSYIDAGFQSLDVGKVGHIESECFKTALTDQFCQHPDMAHGDHLVMVCRHAFSRLTGIVPLRDMLATVRVQWDKIEMQEFGKAVYTLLLTNPSIAEMFVDRVVEAQALMFANFVNLAISRLKKGHLFEMGSEMTALGARHVTYGVHISQFSTFQVSMFSALEDQLGQAFVEAERTWCFVWQVLLMSPFTRGWMSASDMKGHSICAMVGPSLEWLADDYDSMLQAMSASLRSLCRGRHAHMLQALPTILNETLRFLPRFVFCLLSRKDDDIQDLFSAFSSMFPERRACTAQLACLQEAFHAAARQVWQDRFIDAMAAAWSYIWQCEVIERVLLAAFSDFQGQIVALVSESRTSEMTMPEFISLFAGLHLEDYVLSAGFEKLGPNSSGVVAVADIKRALLLENMFNPTCTIRQAVSKWCGLS